MRNKIRAILVTLLIILSVGGIINIGMNYPNETRYGVLVIMIGGWLYWLYKLILSIIENK